MALELNGTTGVSLVQDGVVTAADLASGAITASALPAGSVLQVVTAVTDTSTNIASSSFQDSSLFASITPSSTSSKILIIVNQNVAHFQNTSNSRLFYTQLLRGATVISSRLWAAYAGTAGNGYVEGSIDGSYVYLDSPSTTSSVTYKTQGRASDASNDTSILIQGGGSTSTMTLMEIAG